MVGLDPEQVFHRMINLIMRLAAFAAVLVCAGCNLKTVAMRSLADTVAEPGGVYSRDDDPELVRDALPVMLKIMEQLADGLPKHEGIRLGLVRGFTSYGAAFIEDDADRMEELDVEKARPLYLRAKKMFLRAWGYGLDGLDLAVPGFKQAFLHGSKEDRRRVLALAGKADVPLLYWTGAAIGSAVASGKDDMAVVGELPKAAELMQRALELDESWDDGSIHEFFITYDASRSAAEGGGFTEARKHFTRALELGRNKKLSPLVTYAEAVAVGQQDKASFTKLLNQVIAFDVDTVPENRLVNVLAQRRARWLLSRTADLFAD